MASWVRGKCIGKGAFGVVNIAVSKRDGGVFAVKSVDRKTGLPGQLEALENEIRILRRVSSSPHVVAFLGDDVTCEATASFRNLHLEYMPGGTVADLAEHADVDERLVLVRRFAWCLVNALRHVHALGVVHCDVKGRNVLVGGGGKGGSVAKLADFGAAVEFSGGDCAAPRGSPMWMAPEVLRREYQGPESDVWSLGCTVIEMLTGKPAWADRGVDTLSQIGYSNELPVFPNSLSELGRDFLEKCLNRDRCRRWSCDQLLQHPFLLPNNSNVAESSPRCVLDWVDSRFAESENECEEEEELEVKKYNSEEKENSVKNRIGKLATESRASWETEGWVVVRGIEQGGVKWEFDNVVRVEEGMEEVGTCLEYSDLVSDGHGTTERNVDERVKGGMWRLVLVWRHQHGCDDTDECNRNRKDGIIVIAGSGCGWKCRYRYRWEKFDRIIISGIFSLDSKTESSVVYVSFGSLAVLPKRQMEEIARALLDCKIPFLWVIRERRLKDGEEEEEEEEVSCREELEKIGKIVKWCSQLEVLSHRSLGCFVTHCGWNSTLESLSCGVPMVAFPQWTDQTTNAKLIEDVWKTGVRVNIGEGNIVEGEEIRRCLEVVMGSGGEKGEEVRRNARRWKSLAREAVKEGGSSDKNLRAFLDDVGRIVQNS